MLDADSSSPALPRNWVMRIYLLMTENARMGGALGGVQSPSYNMYLPHAWRVGGPSSLLMRTTESFQTRAQPGKFSHHLRRSRKFAPLPVFRVSQGHASGDITHLEGDAFPVPMEGEGLG